MNNVETHWVDFASRFTVAVCSDRPLICAGIRSAFETESSTVSVIEFNSSSSIDRIFMENNPKVALLDDVTLAERFRHLLGSAFPAAVVVASTISPMQLLTLFDTGVLGVVHQSSPLGDLKRAVHFVAAGRSFIAPEFTSELVEAMKIQPPMPIEPLKMGLTRLTAREQDVLSLICQGRSNREIALTLGISESTVKFHVSHVLSKTSKASRAEVIASVAAICK